MTLRVQQQRIIVGRDARWYSLDSPGFGPRVCHTSPAVDREYVMPIGNQEFGIPRRYQYQIGIWYVCPKFLGIFLVFYRIFFLERSS